MLCLPYLNSEMSEMERGGATSEALVRWFSGPALSGTQQRRQRGQGIPAVFLAVLLQSELLNSSRYSRITLA